ncbi:beta-ketoacyl synthase N-terminal-like domain-containing protein [Serratia microhaemolytica]|uniref:hotdog fold thioesterase n=1 Tax=Serratia microhaemolytica TaxID=2675110 RepID=UPI000FDD0E39|nr:beta-ketoacyl synthase N-terminal-like domain-containing protein [Serratia microhaemolytica]
MEHIAIVGLGCLFPEADSIEQYWQNLLACRDCSSALSRAETEVDPALYYHATPGTGDKINYNRNGHIRGFQFDAQGYALPAQQLQTLDNLFKWTLYAAQQALTDSGYRHQPEKLARTGLLIGNIGMPTHSSKQLMSAFYHQLLTPYLQQLLGRSDFCFVSPWQQKSLSDLNLLTNSHNATVAALALGLQGPSYALDAACASALYAIKMASEYLIDGKADMMLTGAVCHADHIYLDHGFNVLRAFPDNGESIPFDRRSQGLKAGEGAGIIAIKRYADAVRDNDKIYAVIEAIGLSNDAGRRHLLVPDIQGQQLALARAYGTEPPDIDYLECHATGTPVGDQIELSAVEAFFRNAATRPLLGANKIINGHMLTASGMASLFKVILAMQHNVIPPTPGVEQMVATATGDITLHDIVRQARPWPQRQRPKRAAINAFGFGGVNAHLVLSEQHASWRSTVPPSPAAAPQMQPLALVGIALQLAETEQNGHLDQSLRRGRQHYAPLPATRWLGIEQLPTLLAQRGIDTPPIGSWIEAFEFDCHYFRLPPNVVGAHLLSHLFLLPIAERAFLDAGYLLDGNYRNIAVIVASGSDYNCQRYQARYEISWQLEQSLRCHGIELSADDLQALQDVVKDALFPPPSAEGITGGIGNIVASRLAAYLHLTGPALALYSQENSAFKAIELAEFLLKRQQVDAVLIAGCSFGGSLESVLWDQQPVCVNQAPGDGGAVIILQREQDALESATPIYATLEGLSITHQTADSLQHQLDQQSMVQSAQHALQSAGCRAEQVDYIEIYCGARPAELESELSALAQVYSSGTRSQLPTIGTIKANYGHLLTAGGLLATIKCAFQLTQRYLPPLPHFYQSALLGEQAAGRFLLPQQTEVWSAEEGTLRRAAVNYIGMDHACSHLLLREPLSGERARPGLRCYTRSKAQPIMVYTGREKRLSDFMLNPQIMARFAALRASREAEQLANWNSNADQPLLPSAQGSAASALEPPIAQQHTAEQSDLTGTGRHSLLHQANTHLHYLQAEQRYFRLIAALLAQPMTPEQTVTAAPYFDYQQLIELTDGQVSRVLGAEYAAVDHYPIRTRMPSPPYLFVSRITALNAQKACLEPCMIEWEYDIQPDAWFLVDGETPPFVALESSHAMIVAFTVIGCDHLFKGQLCYRAVDSETVIHSEMPRAGEVLRGRVNITSFVRAGAVVLIGYEYFCYVGERLVFKLVASSGFFSRREIANARELDTRSYFRDARPGTPFTPLRRCQQQQFGQQQLDAFMRGDIAGCFGAEYAMSANGDEQPLAAICSPAARMLQRVIAIDPRGGEWGLGSALGEQQIDPKHWAFAAHFKNDPVMPGTLLVEGCEQMVKFFVHYLGLANHPDLQRYTVCQHSYQAKFRGEVKCQPELLRYRLSCKSIACRYWPDGSTIASIELRFIVEILYRGSIIGVADNLAAGYRHRHAAAIDPATTQTALLAQESRS